MPQITFMKTLNRHNTMKISEISTEMSLANSTVSGIADRLEKQNIIKRLRSKEDKRIVNIELTDKGKTIVEEFRGTINEYFEDIFDKCDETQMNAIIEGLEMIKRVLEI
ncbi:MarR family transcriptional regulator [Clostridium sp. ZS2-4]|nr:MarR family transcriptional regulator [Clostridium sp. ZS2-4]MCY6356448.1 MarR family transcriptional regulator [Clostridium sp. ZS2-4]